MANAIFDFICNVYYEAAKKSQKGARVGMALGLVITSIAGSLETQKNPDWKWGNVFFAPIAGVGLGSICGGVIGGMAGAAQAIFKQLEESGLIHLIH